MKQTLLLLAMIISFAAKGQNKNAPVNYDESLVPAYELPDVLTCQDGKRVATRKEWERKRRPELLRLFAEQEYGVGPTHPGTKVSYELLATNPDALGGLATQKQVRFTFQDTDGHQKEALLLLYLPAKAEKRVPVIIAYNFHGNQTTTLQPDVLFSPSMDTMKDAGSDAWGRGQQQSRWSYEMALERGYAVATMCYHDICPDKPSSPTGTIGTWAWGYSRIADYLQKHERRIDADRMVVMGHSRLGKTALWAGAQDERFKVVISNNSGCGGAALSKRVYGENIARITAAFPHWFTPAFNAYSENEAALPFDQHELLALIAPRHVYVASAKDDRWADPKGEYLSAYYAGPVFELYDMNPLPGPPAFPSLPGDGSGVKLHYDVAYHLRPGGHDVTPYDWQCYLDYCDKVLPSVQKKKEKRASSSSEQATDGSDGVRTTFQTSGQWKPSTDVRADAVMVYGVRDNQKHPFAERVKSWRERGYTAHFMTGIAWGQYQDYFTGEWDGQWHMDEGQKTQRGDTIMHGHLVPYIVPTRNYLAYFKEKHVRPVIDQGIDAIFLEEPEFWARAGYSEAFKREWQDFYGFPWRPQHESAENTYLSNKLKYHLYYRALDEAFTFAKAYGREKGLDVKCYVPTHSLLNYSQWQIVSPEASLASMPSCDGYIAQVWTGTSREPNYYSGVRRERVFETAFLEYGCMESMTRPTGRKCFFLTDPIEDRARDWEDYRRNYQATFAAQLLYPQTNSFEVMPWPDRIYEGLYRVSPQSEERAHIPRFYSTQMQVMINTLNDMPISENRVEGSQGISVAMANSLMFQRSPGAVEGYDDPQLSNFYGLALPLLKRGIPLSITHLENTGYEDTWKGLRVLLLSYSAMKPLEAKAHEDIARWVQAGGRLIYCGRDDDAFQRVSEWWTSQGYTAPSEHLFELMGMGRRPTEGSFLYGKGKVYVLRSDPKEFAMQADGHKRLLDVVREAYGKLEEKNSLLLRRGSYVIASCLEESTDSTPLFLEGSFIDLFDPTLPCISGKTVRPGEQAFLLDLGKVKQPKRPQVLAAASRQSDEVRSRRSYSFTAKSPAGTAGVMVILLPRKPKDIAVGASSYETQWDAKHHLLHLRFENSPEGVPVSISW